MKTLCPSAQVPGKRVSALTVRSLVREDRIHGIDEKNWFFCEIPGCDIVYFATDGTAFAKADLNVRVGIKENEAPHTVCYCFDHTVESIQDEIRQTSKSTVFDAISAKVRSGECSCEVMNPKGTCCLGDVRAVVKEAFRSEGSHCELPGSEPNDGNSCCRGKE